MTGRDRPGVAADRRRVQQSALRVGLTVGLASAAIVGLITVITVAAMFATSRPDPRPGRGGGERWDDRILDLDDVVPVAIVLGVLGVLALGVIAWYMARRAARPLAEALEVQRAFVADASHELRTPLTTLTSRIQLAQHRLDRGGDVDGVLDDLRRDAAVMDDVLSDLLLTAETAGARSGDADAVSSVASAAGEAIDVIGPRAADAGIRIEQSIPAGLETAADGTALMRALVALLDNAVRFSPPDGAVSVTAAAAGRSVQVRVVDEGGGIAGDPERLFERFARDDTSTTHRGFGLGLPLVRDIATRFGGTVGVERTSSSGTTFLLVLPAARR
ncbi:HAMP domain-containing sensor histidine kinase [Planococcus sp. APC 4015]|nr:HAMP domain-containing sensor histidine kinase [Planococcus sp. APC 4015]